MSIRVNPIMTDAGYAPAKRVAAVLHKSLQTVHRMVTLGDIEGAREGRVLYVLISSLDAFYSDNAPMRAAVATLLRPTLTTKKKTGT